jgi:hypothetical protein
MKATSINPAIGQMSGSKMKLKLENALLAHSCCCEVEAHKNLYKADLF